MSEIGKSISSCMAFISKVAEECDALANLIKREVSDSFRQLPLNETYQPGEWLSSDRKDASGWILSDAAWSLPLMVKGDGDATAHLGFQLSFLCDDAAGGWSPEPLLHINFWDEPTNVKHDNYMGFAMYGIAQGALNRLREGNARLFRWEADSGSADWWTFSLRIADMNSLEDVRRMICDPVCQLLANVDQGEAFLDSLAGVVSYGAVEEMPDYYRVIR